MRLRSVEVADFGAVERAKVSFEDGLNVLHGPNDLGKSTLAAAIRAALLLQHGSSAARPYIPWGTTRKPTVTLVLEIKGRWWRVHKAFGTSAGGKSVLEWSNDGVTYSLEEEGRGVDGRLRELLEWGLAAPGGRGGSHGFPSSFLATVLLGEQAMPYRLLEQSLDGDAEDSGKARLVEALQAMATDPLYQQVLEQAQMRVDEAFTAKGKRSTRKGSPFERVGAEIKQRREASEQLIAAVAESDAVVSRLGELSVRRDGALTERAAAAQTVEHIEAALEELRVRVGLQAEVDAARGALAEIERNGQEIARLHAELVSAKAAVPEVEAALEVQRGAVRSAELECERARAAAEALRSGEDPQLRAQAQARTEALRELEAQSVRLQARQVQLRAWRAACEQRDEATAQRSQAAACHTAALEAKTRADTAAAQASGVHSTRADALLWVRAEGLRARVASLRERDAAAAAAREEAEAKRAEAAVLDAELGTGFPDPKTQQAMEASWRALQIREAALRGGVRVGLALSQGVRATTDGVGPTSVAGDATIDAEREVVLDLGGLGQVTVRPGDPTAHAALQDARAAWAVHAATLERLGIASVEALREAATARAEVQRERDARVQEAQMLEARASPAEPDVLQSAQRELEAAQRGLEGVDSAACRAQAQEHGDALDAATREAQAESERGSRQVASAAATVSEAQTELRLADQRAEAAGKQEEAARLEGEEDPVAAAQVLRTALDDIEQRRSELGAQAKAEEDGIQGRTTAAKQAVLDAESARAAATQREASLREALDQARATQTAAQAALSVRQEQAQHHDAFAAAERVAQAQDALDAAPVPTRDVSEASVDAARAALVTAEETLEDAERAVRQQEGALQQVGGQVVRERSQMAREALEDACREEAEIELDYDGWRLLLATLREVENETGAHLGRSLGTEVATRMQSLSGGRYRGASLGADLETEGVMTAQGVQALERFSEGVKEQVATLLRVSVAEHLGTALVLDDHLAQTDPERSEWFRQLLQQSAKSIQVVVLTCRPKDYAGDGAAHVVDLASAVVRR